MDILRTVFSSTYGWCSAIFLFMLSYLTPIHSNFIILGCLILIDMFWGIYRTIYTGGFVVSWLMKDTLKKISVYASTLLSVFLIESLFHNGTVATNIVTSIAGSCEIWSFTASILIIYPDMPYVKMLRKYLIKEMEKKSGIDMDNMSEK